LQTQLELFLDYLLIMSALESCIRHECIRRDARFGMFTCTSRKIWEL